MAKVKTTKIQGEIDYAKVPDRIKEFREDCPNGLIETEPTIQDDGQILFKARVLKDKARPESGEGTGHALGNSKGDKAFEKLETIAIGRALAILGYLASGEVASSEEMDEFYAYRETKIDEAVLQLQVCEDIDSLKTVFMSLGNLMASARIIEAKDKRKAELLKQEAADENN